MSIDCIRSNTKKQYKKKPKLETPEAVPVPEYHRRLGKTGPHDRARGWKSTEEIEASKYDFWESVAEARRTSVS